MAMIAAYARVSTDRQAEKQTIAQQIERLQTYAQAHQWPLGVYPPNPPAAGPQRHRGAPPGHLYRNDTPKPGGEPGSLRTSPSIWSKPQPRPAAQAAMVSCDDAISRGLVDQI